MTSIVRIRTDAVNKILTLTGKLPDRLKRTRASRKLTQTSLAKRAQTTHATVSRVERGEQDPAASTLKLLSRALDVSADYLLGLVDDPTPVAQLLRKLADARHDHHNI